MGNEEGQRKQRKERKEDGLTRLEESCGGTVRTDKRTDERDKRESGVGHTARVFRSIPPFRLALRFVPVGTAAHPGISSPLGSHVIERSPSRGETQPIHILCSPLYILRRERKRERRRGREKEKGREKEENTKKEAKGVRVTRGMDRWERARRSERAFPRGWKGAERANEMRERERTRRGADCERRRDPPWLSLNGRQGDEM